MKRRLVWTILALLAVSLIVALFGLQNYRAFVDRPLGTAGPETRLWVAPGASPGRVVAELERLGLTRADWRWRLLARLQQPAIRAGEYRLAAGITPTGLFELLVRGEVVAHSFTIVEGWTLARLRAALAADPRLRRSASALDADALMQALDCTGCFAEGWFLPETYRFQRGDRDLDLLARAHAAMREALEAAWRSRRADLPLDDQEQLLILASLIEQETTLPAEAAQVAGVFMRRLQRGMRLQTDPTVAYGVELPPGGRLRRVHLQTDHPWNTYTRHGLPATPIALPGRAALEAAARPADGDALYFVARGDGSHQFSTTLAEHNAAVRRYILGQP
ncbi:MAG: endolytic transglycosylase MltG [Wenzhouxiangellaceae bacterium]|nr:endolytic transglycosylase MltG [Wenzhouxiangellaceae bacterium]